MKYILSSNLTQNFLFILNPRPLDSLPLSSSVSLRVTSIKSTFIHLIEPTSPEQKCKSEVGSRKEVTKSFISSLPLIPVYTFLTLTYLFFGPEKDRVNSRYLPVSLFYFLFGGPVLVFLIRTVVPSHRSDLYLVSLFFGNRSLYRILPVHTN